MKFCVECGSEMLAVQSRPLRPVESSQPATAGHIVSELEKGIHPPKKTGFFLKLFRGFGRVLVFPFTGPARLLARLAHSKYFQPVSMVGLWSGLLICLLFLVACVTSGGSSRERAIFTFILASLQFGLSIWLLRTWTRERGFLCLITLSVFISVFIAQFGYYEMVDYYVRNQEYYAKELAEWERKRDEYQNHTSEKWRYEPGSKPQEPRPLQLADFLGDPAILAGISGVIISAVTFAVFRKKLLH